MKAIKNFFIGFWYWFTRIPCDIKKHPFGVYGIVLGHWWMTAMAPEGMIEEYNSDFKGRHCQWCNAVQVGDGLFWRDATVLENAIMLEYQNQFNEFHEKTWGKKWNPNNRQK